MVVAPRVAKELVQLFAWVSIPEELLTCRSEYQFHVKSVGRVRSFVANSKDQNQPLSSADRCVSGECSTVQYIPPRLCCGN